MSNQQPEHSKHHTRFYIFMITLVVGGVFLLLYLNNNSENSSITSAIIRSIKNTSEPLNLIPQEEVFGETDLSIVEEEVLVLEKSKKNIAFALSFDKIPIVKKEANIGSIKLNFADPTATITINDDQLELNNLQDINLLITGFNGELNFQEDGILSLAVTVKLIEVNDIAFSSANEIKISISGLNYQSLILNEAQIKSLELGRGNGELTVGSKLQYALEEEEVIVYYLEGLMKINKDSNALVLEGNARGMGISGDLINFDLK